MSAAAPPPAASAPEPAPVSAVGRVVGAFFSPGETFRSIAARPGFLLPVIIWTLVSLGIGILIQPKIDYDRLIRSSLEKRGQTLPEERVQQIVAQQKKIGSVTGTVGPAVAPIIVSLLVTLVFWGAFKAFGWDFTFKQGLGVTTHGFLPNVLGALILIPVLRQRESVDPRNLGDLLRSNLGFLVDQQSAPVVHSLLQSIDVFSFWTIALLTIGYSAGGRTSRKSAAGLVIGVWAVYVLAKAGVAAIFH